MLDEGQFWLSLWTAVIKGCVLALLILLIYFGHKNFTIASSPDPIAAACALDGDNSYLRMNCVALLLGARR